jgi:hypothetical protein
MNKIHIKKVGIMLCLSRGAAILGINMCVFVLNFHAVAANPDKCDAALTQCLAVCAQEHPDSLRGRIVCEGACGAAHMQCAAVELGDKAGELADKAQKGASKAAKDAAKSLEETWDSVVGDDEKQPEKAPPETEKNAPYEI